MQQITLERGDLLQLVPISNTGTIKLLPLGKKNKQKVITGDDSGHLGCYEFKKGEPQTVFLARLFDGPISCVAVGGNIQKRDKIFAAHSQRILGLTKKGKEFFKLTSSLTENIRNIAVEDTKIWTGCEFIYNLYDNGQDAAFYMSRDQINALSIEHISRETDYDVILACQDNCLRVVQGSNLILEIPTASPVTAMATKGSNSVKQKKGSTNIVYGMDTGTLSGVNVQADSYSHLWSLEDPVKRSPITCMNVFDLTKDGSDEIIVGRDDGRLEVYSQDSGIDSKVQLAFSKDIGESIRSTECGMVNSSDYNEVVVASYSGKILSFTAEPVLQRAQDDNYGRSVQTVNNENRIKYLRRELDDLKKQIDKEKDKLKRAPRASKDWTQTVVDFPIISKFIFDKDLAAYVLTIEIQSPIDLVILRSPVVLDLVDSDFGTSVVSVTPPHMLIQSPGEEMPNKFVAAFRCQSQEKRICITLRSTEGDYGELMVTMVAALLPNKAAKVVKFPLRPLSLHYKVHVLTEEELQRPTNKIKFTGTVPLSTLHEWVQTMLPDIPPRIADDSIGEKCFYKNAFTGATTICEYKRNEITFESECASTIAIAKENITRLANYRRIQLEEKLTATSSSVPSFLTLIRSKLEYQLSLARKMELVDAIQEISMQETDISWLSAEYKDILANQEIIRQEFKNRAKSLEYLSGIITDLYVDWHRLQGVDSRTKIPALQHIILSSGSNFDDLIVAFFNSISNTHKGFNR
mmetsp:Transcript_16480/g.15800  ORF Transcript_16480/g.15800 Transcript_16480/m.15800 type:complete len:748 (+) Transcript_16480:77-2320(+)